MNKRIICIAIIFQCIVTLCRATPAQWTISSGESGHRYDLVSCSNLTWGRAATDAEGKGGYLATVTSAAENKFIVINFLSGINSEFYLGAFQPPEAEEPDKGWEWISGEPWIFQNWHIAELGNADLHGNEDILVMYLDGTWNDGDMESPSINILEIPERRTRDDLSGRFWWFGSD